VPRSARGARVSYGGRAVAQRRGQLTEVCHETESLGEEGELALAGRRAWLDKGAEVERY
jgi:hypothetical protein